MNFQAGQTDTRTDKHTNRQAYEQTDRRTHKQANFKFTEFYLGVEHSEFKRFKIP